MSSAAPSPDSGTIRITADISADLVNALAARAKAQDISLTEALSRAIAREKLLSDQMDTSNTKVLVEKNGALTQLSFRK